MACVWHYLQRMGSSGQRKGKVLGLERRSSGATNGAPGFHLRRRFVRRSENRRPPLTDVRETGNRMRFAIASQEHLRGPDRWAFRVARRTGRRDTLHRNARIARTTTAEQVWMRSVPAPRSPRHLSRRWRALHERPGAASSGAGA
jgi:hypothetical protein